MPLHNPQNLKTSLLLVSNLIDNIKDEEFTLQQIPSFINKFFTNYFCQGYSHMTIFSVLYKSTIHTKAKGKTEECALYWKTTKIKKGY